MNNKNTAAEFHSGLKLKKAFMGYDKGDVLESYKKLDLLYNNIIESEKKALTEQISKLNEKALSLEARVSELDNQNKLLSEENVSLRSETALLKQSDADRQAYRAKADILSTAMLRFECEKREQEKQLEFQRQTIIEQANAEAKALYAKFQEDYFKKVNAAAVEFEDLKHRKDSIIKQLKQLEILISQQVRNLDHQEKA